MIAFCFKFISNSVLSNSTFAYFCYVIKKLKSHFKKTILFTHASNSWWWPMKGPKVLGTILVNSSTNSNRKQRHLTGNLKGSWLNYTDKICLYYWMKHAWMNECCLTTHTHTHIYIYIYIYIYVCVCVCEGWLKRSNDDIISAVDNFFNQWNPSTLSVWTARRTILKINLLWEYLDLPINFLADPHAQEKQSFDLHLWCGYV